MNFPIARSPTHQLFSRTFLNGEKSIGFTLCFPLRPPGLERFGKVGKEEEQTSGRSTEEGVVIPVCDAKMLLWGVDPSLELTRDFGVITKEETATAVVVEHGLEVEAVVLVEAY